MTTQHNSLTAKSIAIRVILSIALIVAVTLLGNVYGPYATLVNGKLAGSQFDANDTSYVMYSFFLSTAHTIGSMGGWVVIFGLAIIWMRPAMHLLAMLAMICMAFMLLPDAKAEAYYSDADYAETAFIMPNESAFWVPDVGDNKSSQAKLGSEAYYQENKIAAKRFNIPHTKLQNSGFFNNKYVPAGRLIIVDRTPYNRSWVKDAKRGSSDKDDGVHCQTTEGIDYTMGIGVGASVYEDDAAKFLFRFGVKAPKGDREDPNTIFTSVFYGCSLGEVMDGPVKTEVETLICAQVSRYDLDYDNAHQVDIIMAVQSSVKSYLKDYGITLDYIGVADTVSFDESVQNAINRVYIAKADLAIAKQLAPYTSTIQALAMAEALRNKWNGAGLGSVSLSWMPQNLSSALGSLFGGFIPGSHLPSPMDIHTPSDSSTPPSNGAMVPVSPNNAVGK